MIIVSNNVNQATTTQVKANNSLTELPKLNCHFLSVSELQKKCFIQANHPVWNYIINCNELSVSEKLLYLAIDVDSKMLDGEEKFCEFPASKIAKELGLSKRLILNIQKSLEKKGYLEINYLKTKRGKIIKSILTPRIPDRVFNKLLKSGKNKKGQLITISDELPASEKRQALDRMKTYIPINYKLAKEIFFDQKLSSPAKVMYFRVLMDTHKQKLKKNLDDYIGFFNIANYVKSNNLSSSSFYKYLKELEHHKLVSTSCYRTKTNSDGKKLKVIHMLVPNSMQSSHENKEPAEVTNKVDILPSCNENDCNFDVNDEALKNEQKDLKNEVSSFYRFHRSILQISPLYIYIRNNRYKNYKIRSRSNFVKTGIQKKEHDHVVENEKPLNTDTKNSSMELSESYNNANVIKNDNSKVTAENNESDKPKKEKSEFDNRLNNKNNNSTKQLKDFYPITEEDNEELQRRSGRKFITRVTNEILKDMSGKIETARFNSKKGFMAYMALALQYELRQEPIVNNINFRIVANMSNKEKAQDEINKFLENLEGDFDYSPEAKFKRKLIGQISDLKLYEMFKHNPKLEISRDVLKVHLYNQVELTRLDKEKLLNVARCCFGKANTSEIFGKYHISNYDMEAEASEVKDTEGDGQVGAIEFVMPKTINSADKIEKKVSSNDNVWEKMRDHFQLNGKLSEISSKWFTEEKVTAKIDDANKSIALQAITDDIRSIIQKDYGWLLETTASLFGYEYIGIEFEDNGSTLK